MAPHLDDRSRRPEPGPFPAIPLSGQGLRYALSLELLRAGELSVRELVQRVDAAGFQVPGRPSKTVSDALRWEADHGRVVRVGRGRYRSGRIPRSTIRWMQRALAGWRDRWIAASAAAEGTRSAASDPTAPARSWAPSCGAPSGLVLYRRQQRAHHQRLAVLLARGLRPWARSWGPPA